MKIENGVFVDTDPVVVQYLQNAQVILTTAILSIIMTAPLFAVLMTTLAPRLLDDDRVPDAPDVEEGKGSDAVWVSESTEGHDESTFL